MRILPFLAAVVILTACPPSPSPPGPDASDAATSACAAACANLATLGCVEGLASDCTPVCDRSRPLTDVHPACLASAKSKEAARACGAVTCP